MYFYFESSLFVAGSTFICYHLQTLPFKTGQRFPLADELYFPGSMVLWYQWNFLRCNSRTKQITLSLQKDTIFTWRLGIVLLQGHYFCQKKLHFGLVIWSWSSLKFSFTSVEGWTSQQLISLTWVLMWVSEAAEPVFWPLTKGKNKKMKKVYFSSRTVNYCRLCPLLVFFWSFSLRITVLDYINLILLCSSKRARIYSL